MVDRILTGRIRRMTIAAKRGSRPIADFEVEAENPFYDPNRTSGDPVVRSLNTILKAPGDFSWLLCSEWENQSYGPPSCGFRVEGKESDVVGPTVPWIAAGIDTAVFCGSMMPDTVTYLASAAGRIDKYLQTTPIIAPAAVGEDGVLRYTISRENADKHISEVAMLYKSVLVTHWLDSANLVTDLVVEIPGDFPEEWTGDLRLVFSPFCRASRAKKVEVEDIRAMIGLPTRQGTSMYLD